MLRPFTASLIAAVLAFVPVTATAQGKPSGLPREQHQPHHPDGAGTQGGSQDHAGGWHRTRMMR
jgi:hypothetical protein